MTVPTRLTADALFTACDGSLFDFDTTADLDVLDDIVGQKRATEAVLFAIGIDREGYNLFAFGPEGTGKSSVVLKFLQQRACDQPVPDDWAYVNNFAEPHRPKALRLPAGRAKPLAQDMEQLVEDLLAAIPAAFDTEEYNARKQNLEEAFKESRQQALEELQARAAKRSVAVIHTPMGLAVAPARDGQVIPSQDFEKLPEDEQERYRQAIEETQKDLETALRQFPKWEREHRSQVKALNDDVTQDIVGNLIAELSTRYADVPDVCTYLEEVHRDLIKNATDFLPDESGGAQQAVMQGLLPRGLGARAPLRRYQVNVIVDNSRVTVERPARTDEPGGEGAGSQADAGPAVCAPVVEEEHPTQPHLVGRLDHVSHMGAAVTDFTMIKAGALHRANGGYLVLDARKLLLQPFSYEALKRALVRRNIRIEHPYESYGLGSTATLEPEPIPLDVKVVLLGEAHVYYLLNRYDPEFRQLFKVGADFDDRMDRTQANSYLYARLVATVGKRENLRPLDADAVARVVDYGARLAGDSQKLSTHMSRVVDLVREADYWSREDGATTVDRAHVQKAIDKRTYRSDRIRERIQEEIRRGTIVIDSDGTRVGEVNGLAVYQLDDFAFGKPSRISCRAHLGRGEVIDIERQVDLGGPLHSKGVLILSSYLNSRYASDMPLALKASLVFEQSYGGVEGDSASSTELYALISAIAEVPLRQDLAVTGSVDQNGRVQAIGGVNEKIEGFFDVCEARGLTGDQGVLIPAANVQHLMLREDVVTAAANGTFHIYPIETIDQGVEALTGMPAGERDRDGEFPLGSVNRTVVAQLRAAMRRTQAISRRGRFQPDDDSRNH